MKKLYIFIFLLSLAGLDKVQSQTFTTVSGDPLTNLITTSYGQAWGDFNNDGWIDVYVANQSNNDLLFENDKAGGFLSGIVMPKPFGNQSYGGSWADYDNDNDLDLFVANFFGMNRLHVNDGSGNFVNPSYAPITTDFRISASTAWVDYNNDGILDLSVANFGSSQINNLYRNNGSNSFTEMYTGVGGFDQSVAWSDYDNDGYPEAYFARNNNTANLLFDNDGTSLTLATGSTTMADVSSSYSASWADYDNDGDTDLFVTNSGTDATSVNQLYRNDGGGIFTKITTGDIVNDIGNSRGSDWGDFDNDGWLDLYVANRNQNFLYRNNGDGTFTRITSGDIVNLLNNSYSCSWNDVNNDGFLDLYVITDHSSTQNALFLNNTNSNHYLNAQLVGTVSNRSAIGAKVRVKATINGTPMWQLREVSGQNGLGSQPSLNVEFGLGNATVIDSIEVQWPSGNVQYLTNHPVDQFITIVEGTAPAAPTALTIMSQTHNSVSLQWVDNSANEDQFSIEVSTPDNLNYVEAGTSIEDAQSFVVNNLNPSTTYYFRVRALNSSGYSAYSNEVTTTTDVDPLAAPDNLVASAVSQTEIDLTWNDNSTSETGFVILRSTTAGFGFGIIASIAADETSFNDSGLSPSTTYYYKVKATDGMLESAESNEANATTQSPLAAPESLTATIVSFSEISLSWNDVTSTETGFVIEREIPGFEAYQVIATLGPDATSYSDTGLNPETQYRYRVMATGGSGNSVYSNESTVTTPPAILAPNNLIANAVSHNQISLSWQDNAGNETGYEIERSLTAGSGYSLIFTTAADAISYSDNDVALSPSTTYYYRVRAVNATHQSDYSNETFATTTDYTPVTFSMGNYVSQPGTEVVVSVIVENFTNILTTQLKINWDATALNFVSTEQHNLPTLSGKISNPNASTLIVAWDDEDLSGETLADGSVMFDIRFSVVGADGTFSDLIFAEETGFPEVADVGSNILAHVVNNGRVDVLGLVTLSGRILTPDNQPIENAEIFFDLGMTISSFSDANGNFSHDVMPGSEVYVRPAKFINNVNTNGVTTLDIAMIRRHILAINPFDNPYKLIASDVDKSNSVSTLDIPEIRKVILGLQNDFSSLLWKFVPQATSFANPNNPFPYDTLVHISSAVPTNGLNFYAVKLGDVNDTWDSSIGRKLEGDPMQIIVAEPEWTEEGNLEIPLLSKNFNEILGYQFTVKFDPAQMQFKGLAINPYKIHYSAHKADQGYVTFSWDNPAGKALEFEDETQLLSLQFISINGENSVPELQINSDITLAVGYDGDLNERVIQQWKEEVVTGTDVFPSEIIVKQNYPNPFSLGTTLQFELPKAADVSIRILNMLGQEIDEISGHYSAGIHAIEWDNKQQVKGVLFYQFESGDYKVTKRMVAK